ncbi:poly-beta-1,6-N-acetyl-D-glucosamine N-deacetylase PgaB [Acinetobacter sp. HR7]|uniref:poly-beta-1,6-N-acetyl-D-glucosamine N-deacetylase PgaB n=1 Tax=Acinetobacter sp. HR7 TaxID=1509403 RepID=UPI000536999B|nr:poly-beta-1,6-N-acetyl-D-glucosamine N-deacetylase PgaB [Acinetobacter sp. HR7]KGT47296.1 poly-beta-1,6-N-acetyl-D-glucosamine N-deacetylase PgaB [Acinetobacter sp. HR7]
MNIIKIKLTLALLGCLSLCVNYSHAESTAMDLPENQFVTLTFHDVRDDVARRGDRDQYAISTEYLAQYFAWLKREGWKTITLKDIRRAREQKVSLPEKSVLLTFDDGALSGYTKVFPLLKQYKLHAVFAIPTSWIGTNHKDAIEAYGANNLMNWDQMREMQSSGLVEFVSHSHDMHRGVLANPQKNMQPAATARIYDSKKARYETDQAFRQRVLNDLKRSKNILEQELSTPTHAIFWPYGAVTPETEDIAKQAGLSMSFSLGTMAPLADSVKTYQRALIINNPNPAEISEAMADFLYHTKQPYMEQKSFIQFNLQDLSQPTLKQADEKLSQFLNQLDALKTNQLILKPVADLDGNGTIDVAYFPNRQIKMQQDLLNRTVWQARTRTYQRVYAELPLSLANQGYNMAQLVEDIFKYNGNLEGLVIDAGNELNCAIETSQWTAECKKQIQSVIDLKQQSGQRAKYYANISNVYLAVLKIKTNKSIGLKKLFDNLLDDADYIYLVVDENMKKAEHDQLLKNIQLLTPVQKQRLMVGFDLAGQLNKDQWTATRIADLRKQGIQKISLENYNFKNAGHVQQRLYASVSLNSNPLAYRDPFKAQGEHQ